MRALSQRIAAGKLVRQTIDEMTGILEHAPLETRLAWVRHLFERSPDHHRRSPLLGAGGTGGGAAADPVPQEHRHPRRPDPCGERFELRSSVFRDRVGRRRTGQSQAATLPGPSGSRMLRIPAELKHKPLRQDGDRPSRVWGCRMRRHLFALVAVIAVAACSTVPVPTASPTATPVESPTLSPVASPAPMPPASAIPSASQPSGLVTEQVGRLSVTHPVAWHVFLGPPVVECRHPRAALRRAGGISGRGLNRGASPHARRRAPA